MCQSIFMRVCMFWSCILHSSWNICGFCTFHKQINKKKITQNKIEIINYLSEYYWRWIKIGMLMVWYFTLTQKKYRIWFTIWKVNCRRKKHTHAYFHSVIVSAIANEDNAVVNATVTVVAVIIVVVESSPFSFYHSYEFESIIMHELELFQ